MAFEITPAHARIFEHVKSREGNVAVSAVAGAGKTSTILQMFDPDADHLYLTFARKNAIEVKKKLGLTERDKTVRTLNSLGHGAWYGYRMNNGMRGDFGIDKNKLNALANDVVHKDFGRYRREIVKLARLAKMSGIIPSGPDIKLPSGVETTSLLPDTQETWLNLIDHHDLPTYGPLTMSIVQQVRKLLVASLKELDVLDFDDQLYMSWCYNARIKARTNVFCDEAQDMSPLQHELVARVVNEHSILVLVGDECQPTGTLVDVVVAHNGRWGRAQVEKRPIEQLKIGDSVISMSPRDRQWCSHKKLTGITERPYEGRMIVAKTSDGLVSRYTPNHHCFISFAPHTSKWCVYVMRRGDKYRIGKAKMDYGASGSGLVTRMEAEKADAGWIISLHETAAEALVQEQVVSANFGLPQLMFMASNRSSVLGVDLLANVWRQIEPNEDRASACLSKFGRELAYPLFTNGRDYKKSLKRPMVTHAANIMDGCLVLPYRHGADTISARGQDARKRVVRRTDWAPVTISVENYRGSVWSLTVEGDHTYVADGILTHNCQAIYGFRGADANSMQTMIERFDCTLMPLHVSYRCPQNVVKEARKYVGHIDPHLAAPMGLVEHTTGRKGRIYSPGELVVCRYNAPLVQLCLHLIVNQRDLKVKVTGNNIAANIAALIDQFKPTSVADLLEKADNYFDPKISDALAKGKDEKAAKLDDKHKMLKALAKGFGSIPAIQEFVQKYFDDDDDMEEADPKLVTLSTIHRAKGLEADRVIFLYPEFLPAYFATKKWQVEQERNLAYVAVTRAKKVLHYVHHPKMDAVAFPAEERKVTREDRFTHLKEANGLTDQEAVNAIRRLNERSDLEAAHNALPAEPRMDKVVPAMLGLASKTSEKIAETLTRPSQQDLFKDD